MRNDSELEKAIALAQQCHAEQVDKAGKPYIDHPLRVMAALSSLEEKIVGVLHDAVEDSDLTLDQLRDLGFSDPVIQALDAITKRPGEDYEAYLRRVMGNAIALSVKIADMTDNMDMSRIPHPTAKDYRRLQKYQQVLPRLQAAYATLLTL
ncbi:HD domain-containing protein [Spirulina subsalsa FACHB-351]|uniref:HD domain-containing protein n=1 Tax=Spirulina subsalsa FACHB-351 TaxID=234711 RepID=A0ABT3L701_9CYAN|nr:HD domain-containing protein [Spirulina subsalsa]MCW6037278.1 HD domain-containing protein [Spirulina subsalsa FACHB-351]